MARHGRSWTVFIGAALSCLLLASLARAQAPSGSEPRDRVAAAAAERRATLDRALDELKAAGSEQEAAALQAKLRQLWFNAGTPAVTLLLSRGVRAMKDDAHAEAVKDCEAALVLDPTHAEAWHLLAQARYGSGDTQGAIVAIAGALQWEPRHFAALQTLSRISEAREDWKGAYAAWQKVMELAPRLAGGETRLKDLKRRALGEET